MTYLGSGRQVWAGVDKSGQVWEGDDKFETFGLMDRFGQMKAGVPRLDSCGQICSVLDRFRQIKTVGTGIHRRGQYCIRMDRFGHSWLGQISTVLYCCNQNSRDFGEERTDVQRFKCQGQVYTDLN